MSPKVRLKAGKWKEIAKLHDPSALYDFREVMSFIHELPDDLAPQFLGNFFGPGTSKETAKGMSDTKFFSSFLKGGMAQAASLGQLDFKKVEVLGSIPEGKQLRHVVTRSQVQMGEMIIEGMEVISFKETDGEWKILMLHPLSSDKRACSL